MISRRVLRNDRESSDAVTHPMHATRLSVFAALAFVTTPAARAQRPPAPTVRDSAGVRIVEHRTIKNAPIAFTITTTPQIDLGGLKDDPKDELDARNPFASAFRLSDGRYVASDYAWLKIFDAKGKYIRTIGRSGNGPGEFRQLMQICVARGDTLIAFGYGDGRVSVFDSTGRHVRSFVTGHYTTNGACFEDGTIVVHANRHINPATTMTPERASVLDRIVDLERVHADGSGAGTIGWVFAEMLYGAQTMENSYAQGRSVYTGDGRTADVRIFSIDGKLTQIIRWNDPLAPLTDDEARRRTADMVRGGSGSGATPPHLDVFPAYSHLVADDAGRVWVEDPFSTAAPHGWTLFAADGSLLGRVVPPKIPTMKQGRLELASAHRDYVILRWYDADNGALHVSFHALEPVR